VPAPPPANRRGAIMKIKANGIEINYEKEGSGPVVTLSHSLACNLHMWDDQAKALASRYTVLRFDTRGHGQTSAPTGAYSLDQMAEDLKGLLDGLGSAETHVMRRIGGIIRNTPPAGYIGCCHALPKINVTDRLREIACPALVIVGEEDPGTPVAMAREIHAALPGAQLAILRSASHLSNAEQPEEFNRVLLDFLDKAAGRSAR